MNSIENYDNLTIKQTKMKREQLLSEVKEGKANQINDILEMDMLFLQRSVRNFEDALQDKQREIKTRLKAEEPVDQSVVEVLYKSIFDLNSKINLYKNFQSEFYS